MHFYTDCIAMVSPLCVTSDVDVWNPFHTDGDWLHLYGFYLVCVLICGLRPPLYLKPLLLWLHLNGSSPVCSIKWSSSAAFPEKALLHWLHWYGLSLVCILRCKTRWPFCAIALLHWLHLYDFSLVGANKCLLSTPNSEIDLLHWLHWYGFSPVCILICLLRVLFWEKHCYADCIYMDFPLPVSLHVIQKTLLLESFVRLTAFIWFLSCVYY